MHQVEPWLDATGWGAMWPPLLDREPESAQDTPPHSNDGTRPTTLAETQQSREPNAGDEEEDSEDDADLSELDDNDGVDLEQPEEDDDCDSEEDKGSGNKSRGADPEDGTDEEEVGHHL